MQSIAAFAPAKINLFLAVTGRRDDGYHNLVSVVAPLDFGDSLRFEPDASGVWALECDARDMPCDDSNLIIRAARLFCARTGWMGGGRFLLKKRIPMGAGLGGGSSDAVAALRVVNVAAGRLLTDVHLAELSAEIGSDCPLFFSSAPVVMRGRGERIERLPSEAAQRISGRALLVFKPPFGISTPWAYRTLVAGAPASYLQAELAEAKLARWMDAPDAPVEALLFNSFEQPAFHKFPAFPALLDELHHRFGATSLMSGSGSACFAFVPPDADVAAWSTAIRNAWGSGAFVQHVQIA